MKYFQSGLMAIVTMLFLSACSQTGTTLLNALAKTGDYQKVTDVSYGSDNRNKLDIYSSATLSANFTAKKTGKPVIVFFYGGCWGQCNSLEKSDYLFVAQSFASRGYVTVIPDFRQYPKVKFSTLMTDASQVIRWLSQNAEKYGGDPNQIILMGHSSGAHIASLLTLNSRYIGTHNRQRIRGFVGLAGPYDFSLDEDYQHKLFGPPERYTESQPINFVSANAPPLLLLHGVKDTTVGKHNAVNLVRQARQKGASQQLVLYSELDHVGILLALSRPLQNRSSVLQDVLKFIKRQTN